MENKENLINSLVIKLADSTSLSVGELKSQLEVAMYNWDVQKIENTEISVKDGTTTNDLLDYFRIGKLSSNKSIETIVQYQSVVKQLCDMMNKELNMITTEDVRYFLVMYKHNNNVSDATMESKRLYLSSVFTYLFKNHKINVNPMDCIEPITCTSKVKKPISQEEFELILIACEGNRRLIALIYLLINTGVSVSELCSIKVKDVDFSNKRILVLGKRSKERYVYFNGRTKTRLIDYIKNDRPDITFNNGDMIYGIDTPLIASEKNGFHKLSKNSIEKMIKTLGIKSGVDRIHPHLFRTTFATNQFLAGKDINTVSRLMGHSKIETTALYIIPSEEDIAKFANVM